MPELEAEVVRGSDLGAIDRDARAGNKVPIRVHLDVRIPSSASRVPGGVPQPCTSSVIFRMPSPGVSTPHRRVLKVRGGLDPRAQPRRSYWSRRSAIAIDDDDDDERRRCPLTAAAASCALRDDLPLVLAKARDG
jgi:hypothetical protein